MSSIEDLCRLTGVVPPKEKDSADNVSFSLDRLLMASHGFCCGTMLESAKEVNDVSVVSCTEVIPLVALGIDFKRRRKL